MEQKSKMTLIESNASEESAQERDKKSASAQRNFNRVLHESKSCSATQKKLSARTVQAIRPDHNASKRVAQCALKITRAVSHAAL